MVSPVIDIVPYACWQWRIKYLLLTKRLTALGGYTLPYQQEEVGLVLMDHL